MPAQTHGRVYNGFNIYPRKTRFAQPRCPPPPQQVGQEQCYQKALCCGTPIQPSNRRPSRCRSTLCRATSGNESRKFASTTVIGRSTAAKRAIGRRVANCRPLQPTNTKSNPHDPTAMKCCCMVPTQMGTSCCPQHTVTTVRTGPPPPSIVPVVFNDPPIFPGGGAFDLGLLFPADGFADFEGGTVTLERRLNNQSPWLVPVGMTWSTGLGPSQALPAVISLAPTTGVGYSCTETINAEWVGIVFFSIPAPQPPGPFMSCDNYRVAVVDVAGNTHHRLVRALE